MATYCLTCLVGTAVGEDMGCVGRPSLDPRPLSRGRQKRDPEALQSFGYIASGFRAIGLWPHAFEAYSTFLDAHAGRGHRLRIVYDHEDASGLRFKPYRAPKRLPGYVRANVRFTCVPCRNSFASDSAEWVRAFEPHTLDPAALSAFRERACRPSEMSIHEYWPFNLELFTRLEDWFSQHGRGRNHSITIELRPTRTPKKTAPPAAPVAAHAPSWSPPADPPEATEHYLGAVSASAWPWLVALNHMDPARRAEAAVRLARMADPGLLGYLVAALEDPDVGVRVAAVDAIGAFSDVRTIRPLGRALGDEEKRVRDAAAAALTRAGVGSEAALREARTTRGPYAPAADREETLASRRAIEAASHDPRLDRRHAALLATIDHRQDWARELRFRAAVDPDAETRDTACYWLGEMDRQDPRYPAALLAQIVDRSVEVARRAAEMVWLDKKTPRSAPIVDALQAALKHNTLDVRLSAVKALSSCGDTRATPALAAALDDSSLAVRGEAVRALAAIGGDDAARALATRLPAADAETRLDLLHHLSQIQGSASTAALIAALQGTRVSQERYAIAEGLADRDDPAARAALVAAARKGDLQVAAGACGLLIAEGDEGTVAALVGAFGAGLMNATRAAQVAASGHPRLVPLGKKMLGAFHMKPPKVIRVRWGSRQAKR